MSKLLKQYHDPANPGSYGAVSRFAKSQGISLKKAKSILEHNLGYTLAATFKTCDTKHTRPSQKENIQKEYQESIKEMCW